MYKKRDTVKRSAGSYLVERKGRSLDWNIRKYESLDSTNLEGRRILDAGKGGDGLVVWALHQTQGMGRLGRDWYDLPGKSLLVSIFLPGIEGFQAGVLVAVSIRTAIVSSGGTGPRFKWPNDMVYGDGKVGGILSETFRGERRAGIITGIGLNVGYAAEELSLPAKLPPTSLLIEEKKEWELEQLLTGFLDEMDRALLRDWQDSLADYRHNLAYVGENVRVGNHSLAGEADTFQGIIKGVDESGRLLLQVEGRTLVLASGDIMPV